MSIIPSQGFIIFKLTQLSIKIIFQLKMGLKVILPFFFTSLAIPSSSLYPTFSNISCIAVRSTLEQASPRGDKGFCCSEVENSRGMPINIYDGTYKKDIKRVLDNQKYQNNI